MPRFLLPLILIILGEYYGFVAVRAGLKNFSPSLRTGLFVLYIALTLLTWSGFFLFRKLNWAAMPHLVRNLYVAFTFGFLVAKVVIAAVFLIDELRRIILWVISLFFVGGDTARADGATSGIPRSTFLRQTALVLGGLVLGGFLYGTSNRYSYRVRRLRLRFSNLPESFHGMRAVQISDIHSGSFDSHDAVRHGVEKILQEKPDIIFFTGDLVNNKSDEVDGYQEIFARLKAPMGVYSTLGNHDYGDYVEWPSPSAKIANLDRLKGIHGAMGWRLLMNEHVLLERNGEKIAIVGIENWGAKANFPKYGRMDLATAGLQETGAPFKILLSHDPSHWDAEVRPQYPDMDLTLSGHTHGMQFGIDIPWLKWSPVQYIYKQWAGLYQEGRQFLHVNRGFGFLGYPGRLGIMPEITVIELERGA
jgi:hypothetical protein